MVLEFSVIVKIFQCIVARYKVEEIIIAMPSVKRDVIREIMEICSPLKM